jgi:hypothetical protein
MKTLKPDLCTCTACQQLDRAHPKEGRQIAMFATPKPRRQDQR